MITKIIFVLNLYRLHKQIEMRSFALILLFYTTLEVSSSKIDVDKDHPDLIKRLPGVKTFKDFKMYSGYLHARETKKKFFYWFFSFFKNFFIILTFEDYFINFHLKYFF